MDPEPLLAGSLRLSGTYSRSMFVTRARLSGLTRWIGRQLLGVGDTLKTVLRRTETLI